MAHQRGTVTLDDPGVYIGAWDIPFLAHAVMHTAVAFGPPFEVVELAPSLRPWRPHHDEHATFGENIVHRGDAPWYGGIDDYRWIHVAGADMLPAVSAAAERVSRRYRGRLYLLSSNRFVASIFREAGIVLTPAQYATIGRAPGFRPHGVPTASPRRLRRLGMTRNWKLGTGD